MSKSNYKLKISPTIKQYLKADAPQEKKIELIDGSIPMPLNEMATILTYFLNDADTKVSELAKEELLNIPASILENTLSEDIHPKTLDFYASHYSNQPEIISKILLNSLCPNSVFVKLAPDCQDQVLSLIINNQQRHLEEPTIVSELKKNPNAPSHEIDKAVSFLRVNGVFLEGESSELSQDEVRAILNMEDNMSFEIPRELLQDSNKDVKISDQSDDEHKNIHQLIQDMNIAQKIKIALKGNKEVRSILIKDSNKIVSSAVVKSPKITENEIIAIASLKSIHDEVIRIISTNPQWVKLYALKLALCSNPKTPFKTALTFLKSLNVNDLQRISKNKNVPPQVSKVAKQLFKARRS